MFLQKFKIFLHCEVGNVYFLFFLRFNDVEKIAAKNNKDLVKLTQLDAFEFGEFPDRILINYGRI